MSTKDEYMRQVNELAEFVKTRRKQLDDLLTMLGWSRDRLFASEELATCPLYPSHKMPPGSLAKHVEMCEWKKRGLTEEEKLKELPSSSFFYQKIPSVATFNLDTETQHNILCQAAQKGEIPASLVTVPKPVPATPERSITSLSPAERRTIYDAIVLKAKEKLDSTQSNVLDELQIDWSQAADSDDKPKTREELLAAQRDHKRRRQTYRGKNVATNRKSYTEILREIISNQVNYLEQCDRFEKRKSRDVDSSSCNEESRSRYEDSRSPKRKHKRSR